MNIQINIIRQNIKSNHQKIKSNKYNNYNKNFTKM